MKKKKKEEKQIWCYSKPTVVNNKVQYRELLGWYESKEKAKADFKRHYGTNPQQCEIVP